jgi:hypothetical protein
LKLLSCGFWNSYTTLHSIPHSPPLTKIKKEWDHGNTQMQKAQWVCDEQIQRNLDGIHVSSCQVNKEQNANLSPIGLFYWILVPSSQLHLMNRVGKHKLPVLCMLDFLDITLIWKVFYEIRLVIFTNLRIIFFCWCLNIVSVSCSVDFIVTSVNNAPVE